jgi:hypothetical protein
MEMCKLIPTFVRAFEIQWVDDADKDEWQFETQFFRDKRALQCDSARVAEAQS